MNPTLETLAAGVLAPAAVSLVVFISLGRLLPGEIAERYTPALAFAAGCCVGYWLHPERRLLAPDRHWHTLVYLTPAAAIIGAISASRALLLVERWTLALALSLAAAWLLTPPWPNLDPPRSFWLPALTGYFFLLAVLIEPLTSRIGSVRLLAFLTLTALATATLIAISSSVSYAQLAAIPAVALFACWLAAAWISPSADWRGIGLAYALTIGAWSFLGCIEPQTPILALLIAPAAPLALWLFAIGPLSHKRGAVLVWLQIVAVLLCLGATAALIELFWTSHQRGLATSTIPAVRH